MTQYYGLTKVIDVLYLCLWLVSQIIHPKSDEQRRRLSEAVSKIFLFGTLDQEQAAEVLDAMFEKKVF